MINRWNGHSGAYEAGCDATTHIDESRSFSF